MVTGNSLEALLRIFGIQDIEVKTNGMRDILGKRLWVMGYLEQLSLDMEYENC